MKTSNSLIPNRVEIDLGRCDKTRKYIVMVHVIGTEMFHVKYPDDMMARQFAIERRDSLVKKGYTVVVRDHTPA